MAMSAGKTPDEIIHEPVLVAIYARFSSEMQDPRSIDDQIRECREWAEARGWRVVFVAEDAAVRAGAAAGRHGWNKLLAAASCGEFDIVLFDEVSRFSRAFFDGIADVNTLRQQGVGIADRRYGVFDLDSHHGQVILAVALSSSEEETKRLARRSKRGLRGKVLDGYSAGGQPPYGYARQPEFHETAKDIDGKPKRVGVRWVPDARQARAIRSIFERYAAGESKHGVARWLNAQGIPTRRAGQLRSGRRNSGTWAAATIKRILENPIYIGRRIWNRTTRSGPKHPNSGKKKQVPTAEESWVVVEDERLTIIEAELWDRVQARVIADAKQYARSHTGRVSRQYLLSGLIECAECGHNYVIGARKRGAVHYRCSFSRRGVCGNKVTVPREALERRVQFVLDAVAKDPERLAGLVAEHNARIGQTNEAQLEAVRNLEGQRERVLLERDRFVEAIAMATSAPDVLVKQIEDREGQLRDLAARIEDAKAKVQPYLLPRVAAVRDYVSGQASLFEGDLARDKAFLEGALNRILVFPDGAIVLRFKDDGLFGPVEAYELHDGVHVVGDADLPAKRGDSEDLVRATQEWAVPGDRFKLVERAGGVGIQAIPGGGRAQEGVADGDDPGHVRRAPPHQGGSKTSRRTARVIRPSAPKVLSENSVSVPSGI
ncbi:MAG: recombinase family protein [Sandaracinaceae bacterium]